MVYRPTAHAAEATWCACLVSPLAASALATAVSACACRPGLVMERATAMLQAGVRRPVVIQW